MRYVDIRLTKRNHDDTDLKFGGFHCMEPAKLVVTEMNADKRLLTQNKQYAILKNQMNQQASAKYVPLFTLFIMNNCLYIQSDNNR